MAEPNNTNHNLTATGAGAGANPNASTGSLGTHPPQNPNNLTLPKTSSSVAMKRTPSNVQHTPGGGTRRIASYRSVVEKPDDASEDLLTEDCYGVHKADVEPGEEDYVQVELILGLAARAVAVVALNQRVEQEEQACLRKFSSAVVNSSIFQAVIIVLIVLNSITISLDSPDLQHVETLQDVLNVCELFFVIVFTCEMLLKIVALGLWFPRHTAYLRSAWNWFDGVIVLTALAHLLLPALGVPTANLSALRLLRILRPLRTISTVRGMRTIVQTLLFSLPLLGDVFLLMLFLIAVFAILGVQMWADTLHQRCFVNASDVYYEVYDPALDDNATATDALDYNTTASVAPGNESMYTYNVSYTGRPAAYQYQGLPWYVDDNGTVTTTDAQVDPYEDDTDHSANPIFGDLSARMVFSNTTYHAIVAYVGMYPELLNLTSMATVAIAFEQLDWTQFEVVEDDPSTVWVQDPLDDLPCSTFAGGRRCDYPWDVCQTRLSLYHSRFINFDHMGSALLFVFKVVSLDDWPEDMWQVQNSYTIYVFFYFMLIVLVASYFSMNLFLAVLSSIFSDSSKSQATGKDAGKMTTVIDIFKKTTTSAYKLLSPQNTYSILYRGTAKAKQPLILKGDVLESIRLKRRERAKKRREQEWRKRKRKQDEWKRRQLTPNKTPMQGPLDVPPLGTDKYDSSSTSMLGPQRSGLGGGGRRRRAGTSIESRPRRDAPLPDLPLLSPMVTRVISDGGNTSAQTMSSVVVPPPQQQQQQQQKQLQQSQPLPPSTTQQLNGGGHASAAGGKENNGDTAPKSPRTPLSPKSPLKSRDSGLRARVVAPLDTGVAWSPPIAPSQVTVQSPSDEDERGPPPAPRSRENSDGPAGVPAFPSRRRRSDPQADAPFARMSSSPLHSPHAQHVDIDTHMLHVKGPRRAHRLRPPQALHLANIQDDESVISLADLRKRHHGINASDDQLSSSGHAGGVQSCSNSVTLAIPDANPDADHDIDRTAGSDVFAVHNGHHHRHSLVTCSTPSTPGGFDAQWDSQGHGSPLDGRGGAFRRLPPTGRRGSAASSVRSDDGGGRRRGSRSSISPPPGDNPLVASHGSTASLLEINASEGGRSLEECSLSSFLAEDPVPGQQQQQGQGQGGPLRQHLNGVAGAAHPAPPRHTVPAYHSMNLQRVGAGGGGGSGSGGGAAQHADPIALEPQHSSLQSLPLAAVNSGSGTEEGLGGAAGSINSVRGGRLASTAGVSTHLSPDFSVNGSAGASPNGFILGRNRRRTSPDPHPDTPIAELLTYPSFSNIPKVASAPASQASSPRSNRRLTVPDDDEPTDDQGFHMLAETSGYDDVTADEPLTPQVDSPDRPQFLHPGAEGFDTPNYAKRRLGHPNGEGNPLIQLQADAEATRKESAGAASSSPRESLTPLETNRRTRSQASHASIRTVAIGAEDPPERLDLSLRTEMTEAVTSNGADVIIAVPSKPLESSSTERETRPLTTLNLDKFESADAEGQRASQQQPAFKGILADSVSRASTNSQRQARFLEDDGTVTPPNRSLDPSSRGAIAVRRWGKQSIPPQWQVIEGFNAFKDKDAMITKCETWMDELECRRICLRKGYGGFAVHEKVAYFRKENAELCRRHLREAPGAKFHLPSFWESHEGKGCFEDRPPALRLEVGDNIEMCVKECLRAGYGGFSIKDGIASFRTESPRLLRSALRAYHDCDFYTRYSGRNKAQVVKGCMQKTVEHEKFEQFMLIVTVANVVALGAYHYNIRIEMRLTIEIVNLLCSLCFTAEIIMKFVGLGVRNTLRDGFNRFDFLLVLIGIPQLVFSFISYASGGDDGGGNLFSVFRLLRVARVLRLGRRWPRLRNIIKIVISSLSSVAYLSLLLILMMFVYGVLGMQLFGYNDSGNSRLTFQSLFASLLTVFVVVTGEGWSKAMVNTMYDSGWPAAFFFISLFVVGRYIFLNLFIAIIIERFQNRDDTTSRYTGAQSSRASDMNTNFDEGEYAVSDREDSPNNADAGSKKGSKAGSAKGSKAGTAAELARAMSNGRMSRSHSATLGDSKNATVNGTAHNGAGSGSSPSSPIVFGKVVFCDDAETVGEEEEETEDAMQSDEFSDWDPGKDLGFSTTLGGVGVDGQSPRNNAASPRSFSVSAINWNQLPGDKKRKGKLKRRLSIRGPPPKLSPAWFGKSTCGCFSSTGYVRRYLTPVCTSPITERLIVAMITLNLLFLAFENPDTEEDFFDVFFYADIVFSGLYFLEMVMKLIVFGVYQTEHAYLKDLWNAVDVFIVVTSILGFLVPFFTLFRSFRVFRLITKSEHAKVVLYAAIGSVPSIMNGLVVSGFVFILFAITGVQLLQGLLVHCTNPDPDIHFKHECEASWYIDETTGLNTTGQWRTNDSNFDHLGQAIFTLFKVALSEQWNIIMFESMDAVSHVETNRKNHQPGMAVFFILFFVIANFLCLNLIISILINSFSVFHEARFIQDHGENYLATKFGGWEADTTRYDIVRHNLLTEDQRKWVRSQKLLAKDVYVFTVPKNKYRRMIHEYVLSPKFEYTVAVIIVLNLLLLCSQHRGQSEQFMFVFDTVNLVFIFFYVIEFVLKILGFGWGQYWRDGWNRFDCIVLLISIVGVIVGTSLMFFRVFRIGRLLRLFHLSKGLSKMFTALLYSLPHLFNIGLLLCCVFFVFGIIGVELYGTLSLPLNPYLNRNLNFSTLLHGVLLLFQISTGEMWLDVLRGLRVSPPHCEPGACGTDWSIPYLVLFMIIVSFLMVNLFVAVVLEAFQDAGEVLNDDSLVRNIHDFRRAWLIANAKEDDPDEMPVDRFIQLISDTPPPLGPDFKRSKTQLLQVISDLNIPLDASLRVYYRDVVGALQRRSFNVSKEEAVLLAHFSQVKVANDLDTFTIAHYYCVRRITDIWKAHMKAKQERRLLMGDCDEEDEEMEEYEEWEEDEEDEGMNGHDVESIFTPYTTMTVPVTVATDDLMSDEGDLHTAGGGHRGLVAMNSFIRGSHYSLAEIQRMASDPKMRRGPSDPKMRRGLSDSQLQRMTSERRLAHGLGQGNSSGGGAGPSNFHGGPRPPTIRHWRSDRDGSGLGLAGVQDVSTEVDELNSTVQTHGEHDMPPPPRSRRRGGFH